MSISNVENYEIIVNNKLICKIDGLATNQGKFIISTVEFNKENVESEIDETSQAFRNLKSLKPVQDLSETELIEMLDGNLGDGEHWIVKNVNTDEIIFEDEVN